MLYSIPRIKDTKEVKSAITYYNSWALTPGSLLAQLLLLKESLGISPQLKTMSTTYTHIHSLKTSSGSQIQGKIKAEQ